MAISAFLFQFCGHASANDHSLILKCEGRQKYQFLPALNLNAPDQEEIKEIGPLYYQLDFRGASGVRILSNTTGSILFDWKQCNLKENLVSCERIDAEDSTTRFNISRQTGAAVFNSVTMNSLYKAFTTANMQCEVMKSKKLF